MNKHNVFCVLALLSTLLAFAAGAEEMSTEPAAAAAGESAPAAATAADESAPPAAMPAGEETAPAPAAAGSGEEPAPEPAPAAAEETPAAPAPAAKAAPAGGNALVQKCSGCHGADGNSGNSAFPSIAGMSADNFKYVLEAYRNGGRRSAVMQGLTGELSAQETEELANYFARQTFKAPTQAIDSALADKGAQLHKRYCVKCHGLAGDADDYGLLAGQWLPYLRQVLQEYQAGTRAANPVMHSKLQRLQAEVGEQGIEQLAQFYASRPAPAPR